MGRSSGTPRRRAFGVITRIIAARASATTITRVTTSTGQLDETTESQAEHTESLWVFEPSEVSTDQIAGDRISGDLAALAEADGTVDIEPSDRLTHGGVEYDVQSVVGRPDDEQTDYWLISLARRS